MHLVDGTREEVFDRITKKLARIFEVPIALITFIDRDHQWFKSQVGLPEEIAEAQRTSRELSVCGHVVANDELLVVEDLARDRRFANNPLLKRAWPAFLRWRSAPNAKSVSCRSSAKM